MKIFIALIMAFQLFAMDMMQGVESEITNFKQDSKKEKLSYSELLSYLTTSGDKNKIMIAGILYANDSPDADDFGEYIKADPVLSFKYLEQSYKMGNPRALAILGSLILYNDNLAKLDPELLKAEEYLRVAINEGDLEAKLILANVLLVKYKYDDAIFLLKEASEEGDSSASMQLAFIYLKGIYSEKHNKIMVKKDDEAANYFLNIACNAKNKSDSVKEFCFSPNVETFSK